MTVGPSARTNGSMAEETPAYVAPSPRATLAAAKVATRASWCLCVDEELVIRMAPCEADGVMPSLPRGRPVAIGADP
jgi:hypothetical protein